MKARDDSRLEKGEVAGAGDASAETQKAPVFDRRASIQDPDGFTNIRSAPSASSEILTVVYEGEVFRTFQQEGVWWQVRTSDGATGWMHVSRIYLLK
jgi:uncharacterized protein YgiM (DUF1202 family)